MEKIMLSELSYLVKEKFHMIHLYVESYEHKLINEIAEA